MPISLQHYIPANAYFYSPLTKISQLLFFVFLRVLCEEI
jgi:hypothetical protein